MGALVSKNSLPVDGRTVLITGGSRGLGLEAGRQLAAKGANVVIVARDVQRLQSGIKYISDGAVHSEQRFHQISADMSSAKECQRVIAEASTWNENRGPDIVWCCAGSSHPTLFADTPIEALDGQMSSNYFSSLYTAHATVKRWLADDKADSEDNETAKGSTVAAGKSLPSRHLIFTGSFLSLYSFTGYSSYAPCKAALRALSDTLSQEMNLYASANPRAARIRLHTVFPGTIFTESYEAENKIKSDVTLKLEEGDGGQTADVCARKSIEGLESGREWVSTNLLGWLVSCSVMGGSVRGGALYALGDGLVGMVLIWVMMFVRWDMDTKVRKWGRTYGSSGMKVKERKD